MLHQPGDRGGDVHGGEARAPAAEAGEGCGPADPALSGAAPEDDGRSCVRADAWLAARDGAKLAGVFAVSDARGDTQFVSYARDVVASVRALRGRLGPRHVAAVRARIFAASMARREELNALADAWLREELPHVPPGNAQGEDASRWRGHDSATALSGAALASYEDNRLRLRRAMGENLADAEAGESASLRERRLAMLSAVHGDDWSEVIGEQTAEAVGLEDPGGQREQAGGSDTGGAPIASPFSAGGAGEATAAAVGTDGDDGHGAATGGAPDPQSQPQQPALSMSTADECLDAVRPYLVADGGNVEVVGVAGGVVLLRLTGACGTCPSSAATMSMGLEKALRATFGEQVQEVVQVDGGGAPVDTSPGALSGVTIASVEAHLEVLRPTVEKYGGSCRVVSVSAGGDSVAIEFEGPAPMAMGIEAALKDKFPTLKHVDVDIGG